MVKSISFSIPAGSFAGIVGRSGSGKSTIMKLLPRLYEPTSGRILIDGYDISKLQLGSVRVNRYCSTGYLLFEGTIETILLLLHQMPLTMILLPPLRLQCSRFHYGAT